MSTFLRNLETTNSKLAAALCAVGIPLSDTTPVRIITGCVGPDRVAYFFGPSSPCGLYHAEELIKAWDDDEWHAKNPEHPFAYIKVALQNLDRLNDYCRRGTPIAFIKQGSKIAFMSVNAPGLLQKKLFAELKR